jgi:hypothetical protein
MRPDALRGNVTSLAAPFVLRERSRFIIWAAVAPAVLLLGHVLPDSEPGLALRLAGAAACVLVLPGALLLRALAWPSSLGIALAASFAFSLALDALALALVFLVGSSIVLAIVVVAIVSACAAVPAALRRPAEDASTAERRTVAVVLGTSALFAGAVWWAAAPISGDGFFHLGRVRKLVELDSLDGLSTVTEFQDGGLHPGYAFPLWHGVDALVARLAGADAADVVVHLPAILVPLAFVLAYAAGAAVFRSWAGGAAFVAVQAAWLFSRREGDLEGTGLFGLLSQPREAGRALLAPAMLALAFAFVAEGGWIPLAGLAAASFGLSAVHPTYAPYVALVFGGFLVARALAVRGWEPLLQRAALALGAIVVPFGLVLLWLLPVVRGARPVTPSASLREQELEMYNSFTTLGSWFGYSPGGITREGIVVIAGLLAVPLAGFAARRLWAAFVLGGSLAVLTVLLTPPLFTALSDAISVSQSRRLPQFLPIAFAVVGGCVVVSRLRALGVGLAALVSIALVLLYPAGFTEPIDPPGVGWPVWVAVAGGLAALVAGVLLRRLGPSPSLWTAAAAVAFTVPVAVVGLSGLEQRKPKTKLTAPIIAAVRAEVPPGDVVFSDRQTAYEIAAFAPVHINAAPLTHATDTKRARMLARSAAASRFYGGSATDADRRAILERYLADWVLVDKQQPHPEEFLRRLRLTYEDDRYALYEVDVS